MHSVLEDVVKLGGLALQSEDCLIRAALYSRGKFGGLATMENERHHQFIIWRAVLPIWDAVLERENSTDLILRREDISYYFELKNWRGSSGNTQLGDIQKDVTKLQSRNNGYFLITTCNNAGAADENIEYLLTKISGLEASQRQDFRFRTVGSDGRDRDYLIAGWPVLRTGL